MGNKINGELDELVQTAAAATSGPEAVQTEPDGDSPQVGDRLDDGAQAYITALQAEVEDLRARLEETEKRLIYNQAEFQNIGKRREEQYRAEIRLVELGGERRTRGEGVGLGVHLGLGGGEARRLVLELGNRDGQRGIGQMSAEDLAGGRAADDVRALVGAGQFIEGRVAVEPVGGAENDDQGLFGVKGRE